MSHSKTFSRGCLALASHSHKIESCLKLASLAVLAGMVAVACNKGTSNSVAGGAKILSVTSGGVGTSTYGGTQNLTVTVGNDSGLPAQAYSLNASIGAINGDLRQIGENVYELQATCANSNCTDVAFMIIDRKGFANTSGTFNSYLGTNPLVADGVTYPPTATSQYVLTSQPTGSVEFLYKATWSSTGSTWVLAKTLSDTTGTVTILSNAQIAALEQQ